MCIRLGTSTNHPSDACTTHVGLWEEEPQTDHLMSFTWVSHIAASMLAWDVELNPINYSIPMISPPLGAQDSWGKCMKLTDNFSTYEKSMLWTTPLFKKKYNNGSFACKQTKALEPGTIFRYASWNPLASTL